MSFRHVVRVRCAVLASALLPVAAVTPRPASAQFVEVPPPAAYALTGVTVVQANGARAAGQTIVVRAGRIEAIGANVAVPADARVLAGDSLFVYPALIDAAGQVRHEFPQDTIDRSRVRSWDPPRSMQGFTPARRVLDALQPRAADLTELRRKGVLAVAVHPTDPLMPGRGALLLLRSGPPSAERLVLRPTLGPVLSLRGGRGVYPSTLMGVISWYRQKFMDAQRRAELARVASADPRAALPPAFDPDLAVVQELLRGETRPFFTVNDADDIRRVLRLADEFDLEPIIVGGGEAWKVADELRTRNVPVLVSVDFPRPRRWKPESDTASSPNGLEPAAAREKRQLEEQYANAGRLAQAGVTFALVSGGNGDLREGARKAIEYGLTEQAALRALTATPATLLDVAHLARLEAGLPATFVVTDAPIFEKDARVLHTFVEGAYEKGADTRARNGGEAPAEGTANVAGTWSVDVTGPMAQSFTMRLTQDGESVSGTIDGPEGSISVDGRVQGDRLTLRGTLEVAGQSFGLDFSGTVRGDEASGTVSTPMGSLEWRARRTGGNR
jgi:imidazolonepropionase-like amidohydrolase